MKRVRSQTTPLLKTQLPLWRGKVMLLLLLLAFLVLAGRALHVQVLSHDFLQRQGGQRYERGLILPAMRGKILDRNGKVLASSVPARAIWAIPDEAKILADKEVAQLAKLLDMTPAQLRTRLTPAGSEKNFVYLKRQVSLERADAIKRLKLPGIHQQEETRREYPEGELTASVLGFTNTEDQGIAGVELAFDAVLAGQPGSRRVIKDRLGRVIEDISAGVAAVDGQDVHLSLDAGLQFDAYTALRDAMKTHKAAAASAVIIDVQTGEILAMVSLPTFDPNAINARKGQALRNRVLLDTFEPGSIMKPFTAALALDLQRIDRHTRFDTGNGQYRYQGKTISDVSRNGELDVAGVLRRSSNIGMTLIAQRLSAQEMWGKFTELGFGRAPQTRFPGVAAGRLRPWDRWRPIEQATMAYGYGLSASLLQVAKAYTAFARQGDMVTLSLVPRDNARIPVYTPATAQMMRQMLEAAAGPDGAKLAQVQGYRVAGKSGTARKIVNGQYSKTRYRSSFVGFAPVSDPRIVVAVSLDEPQGHYLGGRVAAPVFSDIVANSLRRLHVQPDAGVHDLMDARHRTDTMSMGTHSCVPTLLGWLCAHATASARLHLDSRTVQAGDVFFACPGKHTDGRQHVADAVARGAAAVIMQADAQETLPDIAVPLLRVDNLRDCMGELAHEWYGRVTSHMTVIAVTGTNGKTTTTQWLAAALNGQGMPCGVIGTLGMTLPDGATQAGQLTTPDVLSLHYQLAVLHRAGARAVALEASSIGIEQGRLDGVRIQIAAFTNLTLDHLDYHQTMQAYQAAKFCLFERAELHHVVVNVDDAAGRELVSRMTISRAEQSICTYALNEGPQANTHADFRADQIQANTRSGAAGLTFTLTTPGHVRPVNRPINSPMIGRHNVANLLLVAAVLSCLNPQADLATLLESLPTVDGRLQTVQWMDGEHAPLVVVDYAHTPDALARALQALHETTHARAGKLWCVFGCGGDRDRSKRPIMGKLAQQHADHVVLTSDNPRSENAQTILADIQAGLVQANSDNPPHLVQADRALAILHTLWQAQANDVVLIAGKGHETYQEIHGQRQPFDDRVWAQLALALRSGATVQTDSRNLRPGALFLALAGENFDGHDYLDAAQTTGACAAIVSHVHPENVLRQLPVGDTRAALGKLGQAWRAQFTVPLIAVTGSNGKTTVKEMIACILRAGLGESAVLATQGNLNNDLGVPLTLLRLQATHRAAVVELGMNHPNEIAALARMAQPTIALVNNAQREHQEFMRSVEVVARENGCVLAALPTDGTAVYPAGDMYSALWGELSSAQAQLQFGFTEHADITATDIRTGKTHTHCLIHTPADRGELHLPLAGRHNLHNALAALACTHAVGVPLATALTALASFAPVNGRMQHIPLANGGMLIDDTYNANPDSVRAAIDVLACLPPPHVLVLGDMGEVGEDGPALHREVGAYARACGIYALYTMGEAVHYAREGHAREGYRDVEGPHGDLRGFDGVEPLVDALIAKQPASILVKGSRFMRMERVVQALLTCVKPIAKQETRHVA